MCHYVAVELKLHDFRARVSQYAAALSNFAFVSIAREKGRVHFSAKIKIHFLRRNNKIRCDNQMMFAEKKQQQQ